MLKLMLGFAAGWWVGSRQALGQPVLSDDLKAKIEGAVQAVAEVTSTTQHTVIGGRPMTGGGLPRINGYRRR